LPAEAALSADCSFLGEQALNASAAVNAAKERVRIFMVGSY
jgi:hypothetical protein